jgi:hypothetical protein
MKSESQIRAMMKEMDAKWDETTSVSDAKFYRNWHMALEWVLENPSVDSSVCQPSEGAPVAKAGDASPEVDTSVGGRRSECEGVRDESPKDTSGGSPTTVKAGCKDSRREGEGGDCH